MHTFNLIIVLLLGCETEIKNTPVEPSDEITVYTDSDGDGYISDEDCDDMDAGIHPGVEEICDGLDNNCDGQIDEGVTLTFYLDADEDGFGDPNTQEQRCEQGIDTVPNNNDCDDTNPEIYPGVEEICDGLDNNCDGDIDEDIGDLYYLDADEDGFGDPNTTVYSCDGTSSLGLLVDDNLDCDDNNNQSHPLATEYCDEIDNNCDGQVDETGTISFYLDNDGDGYGDANTSVLACSPPENYIEQSGDCDDTNSNIAPDQVESCDNIDNNCNGWIDDADPSLQGGTTYYLDADGDGFGTPNISQVACVAPSQFVTNSTDCNDLSVTANPSATEVCDGIDNDCDGDLDDNDSSIDITTQSTAYIDQDGDGYGSSTTVTACLLPSNTVENSADCNDADPQLSPSTVWYLDADNDGFGGSNTINSCLQPAGYVSQSNDCNDQDANLTPTTQWYFDGDGDGYGAGTALIQCTQPNNYVLNADDCNNVQPLAWNNAPEICDGIDNDCDGDLDEGVTPAWYFDGDGDGYGDDAAVIYACTAPSSYYVEQGGDCDDGDPLYSPGNSAGCDNRDLNCDGLIDNDADGDGYSDASCGGLDCDDADPNAIPEVGGGCALGNSCLEILESGMNISDIYLIDPDGFSYGEPPFETYCDMVTDGGGWTQIAYVFRGDLESYNTDYSDIFSSIQRGLLGSGSYKVDASMLLLDSTEFRYSEPYDYSNLVDSTQNAWYSDISCVISTPVLNNILNPGIANQPGANIDCTNLNTGNLSTTAIKMNYQGWPGSWYPTRLWVGNIDDNGNNGQYHGNYVSDGVATWSNISGTAGVYYGPANRYNTSVAFWVR